MSIACSVCISINTQQNSLKIVTNLSLYVIVWPRTVRYEFLATILNERKPRNLSFKFVHRRLLCPILGLFKEAFNPAATYSYQSWLRMPNQRSFGCHFNHSLAVFVFVTLAVVAACLLLNWNICAICELKFAKHQSNFDRRTYKCSYCCCCCWCYSPMSCNCFHRPMLWCSCIPQRSLNYSQYSWPGRISVFSLLNKYIYS